LQEVVTSVTLASFTSLVAARTASTSITPSSARPTAPPAVSCSQRRRLSGSRSQDSRRREAGRRSTGA
jgi:hypothetical protein